MKPAILQTSLLLACAVFSFAQNPEITGPLSAFVGHWEGGGTFYETAMSKAGTVTSRTDCAWSPEGHYLVCEQNITDEKGSHQQLTVYTPSTEGSEFTFYTITGSAAPFTGKVKIEGNKWTYDNSFEQDGKKTEVRTINLFTADEETFKTEYSVDGGPWTAMLDGKSHRVKK
jgi:hypothetical protein